MRFLFAAFVTMTSLAPACGVETKTCTLVACYSTVTLEDAPAVIDRSAPERITVRACLDDRCWSAAVRPDPANAGVLGCTSPTGPDIAAFRCAISANTFKATLMLYASDTAVKDGNVVRITVDDASGRVFDTGDRTLTYTTSRPNGPDCDPTCKSTTL